MLYNQPYGVSDPNAAYINGNPSTGTMGSIPPAASIEFPQREIVNLISDTGLTPTNSDLHQLGKGIQGGKLTYGVEIGSLSDFHLQMTPQLLAYVDGMTVRFRARRDAPGPCTLRIDNLAQIQLVKRSSAAIQAYDFAVNDMLDCIFDGVNNRWMIIGLSTVSSLHAPLDYYVNFASGDDNLNDGLSTASPFKTIFRAIQGALSFNQNGFSVNIHCADGASLDQVPCPPINGSGMINIYGNTSNPSLCTITIAPSHPTGGSCFVVFGPNYSIQGFTLSCQKANPNDANCGVWSAGPGVVKLGAMNFGSCINCQIGASLGELSADGPFIVSGTASCFTGSDGGTIQFNQVNPPAITLQAGTTYTQGFAVASRRGLNICWLSSITGSAIGPKYLATGNGVVDSGGKSVSFFPGNAAGALGTGGQYT
jgi:hypothetical protein